jgi:AraC-like DNA-binding protein
VGEYAEMVVGRLRLPAPGSEAERRGAGLAATRCIGFAKTVAEAQRRRELPSRHINLMISFGDPLRLVDGDTGRVRRVESFVSGVQTESALTERLGRQHGMHVELSPLAARALFGLPMDALANALVDLPTIWGRDADSLIERLAYATCWPDRFAILQAASAVRIAGGRAPTPAVAWAWQTMRATNGSVRVHRLVQESGMSHRHFVARFRSEIGVTPKEMARVLRFEHSVHLLQHTSASLAEIAAVAGFCDQSHLNREFNALAGCSPQELVGDRPLPAVKPGARSDLSKTG